MVTKNSHKIVCYTCCTGGYDDIPQYEAVSNDWDYVFFTDNKELIEKKHIGHWEIRPLVFDKQTNVKNARWHKVNTHILFPNYEASLWLDANIIVKSPNVINKVEKMLADNIQISVPLHPARACIYEEAKIIIGADIDYAKTVKEEMKHLKTENYPTNNGLHETCIIFRRHNNIKDALSLWWQMIEKYSKRDQLSFDYAIWKNNISVLPFYEKGTEHRENGDFLYHYGKKHNQDKLKYPNFKIFKKVKGPDGKRTIYLLGIKLFSYKKKNKKYKKIYAKRFKGLTEEEIRYCLEVQFKKATGYELNLDNPQTFNEKIQWLKLYYRDPLMTKCADKVGVRDYVKEKIGEEYLVPIIGIYNSADEIDFDALPNKFVAKVNWGSGQNIIVTDKSKLDIKEAKQKLSNWMKPENNHYYSFFEWVYKDIEPKIIVEEFLQQFNGDLYDYKFYCFNNQIKFMLIVSDRFNNKCYDFYDAEYNKLPFTWTSHPSPNGINKPNNFEEMMQIAQKLSKEFPFVRVDFFDTGEKLYIGELTFYPGNGTDAFEPVTWDYKFGEMLKLPNKTTK